MAQGAAGSEIQPYLEGGIEAEALSGGRRGGGRGDAGSGDPAYKGGLGGARCLPIGFGEDRETRCLTGWALPDWALAGRGRTIWGFCGFLADGCGGRDLSLEGFAGEGLRSVG